MKSNFSNKFFCIALLAMPLLAAAQFLPDKTIAGSKTGFYGIQTADINADGHPDLVAIRGYDAQAAYWYLNDGQGHFPINPSDSLELDVQIAEIIIADLNGDGFLDFAFADFTATGNVFWYAGDGQGHFVKHLIEYYDGIPVGTFKAADIDADGDQDLVLGQSLFASTLVRWVKNDGQGNFSDPYQLGEHSEQFLEIVIADLNNDNLPEVLIPNKTTWYLNYGPGNFDARPLPADAVYLFGIEDLDSDGDRDLLAYGYNSNNKPILFRNTANPFSVTFVPEELPLDLDLYDRFFTGDFDGDGDTDFLFNSTGWWENDGTGSYTIHDDFTLNHLYIPANYYLLPPGVDLDGDGRDEAVVPGQSWVGRVGLNTSEALVADIIVPDIFGTSAVKSFDFDNDGDLDIVAAADKLYWFSNEGGGHFGPRQTITALPFHTGFFKFIDIDGDQDLDIFIQNGTMLRNLGFGYYANPAPVPLSGSEPHFFDFDADGDTDIVGSVPLQFFENIGNGNLANPVYLTQCFSGSATVADMDHDSDLDLAFPCDKTVIVLTNDGTANFTALQDLTAPNFARRCFWADVDGSGSPDVIAALDSGLIWFPRLPDGSFGAFQWIFQSGSSALDQRLTLADFDGDGDIDIAGSYLYYSFLLKNDGTGVFATVYLPFYNPFLSDDAAFDVDGDQDLDLLFANEQTIGWLENLASEAYLSGTCYWDKNENQQRDPGEPPFQNQILRLEPAGKLTFTDADGSYRLYADSGQFALSIEPDSCWDLSTDTLVYHLFFDGITTVADLDFGLKLNGTEKKLTAPIATAPTRCGFEVPCFLSLRNEGCALATGIVELHFTDSLAAFVSATPPPTSTAPGLLTWLLADTLLPGGLSDIQLVLQMAGPEHLGDTLRLLTLARALDDLGNPEPEADSTLLLAEINCAYDPNDKLVSRSRLPENYAAAASELVYTVRFQNTGTDTAFNVTVRDRLAAALDFSTFKPLGTSHAYTVTLDSATRTAVFAFKNILLPDSSVNEPGSHGLFQFSIYPMANLPAETLIQNSAGIYFDFNPPVLTNMAETWVEKTPVSTSQLAVPTEKLRLFPNPASGEISLEWTTPLPASGGRLLLSDMAGRNLQELKLPPSATLTRWKLFDLPRGMYWVRLESESGFWQVAKLVKLN
ncbi:MAG: VCBS repeat-containing protein [Saprospiraceae bacterium]|nr:VCBS repeat-containing protein [Saprospiraceae bacterium]